MNQDVKTTIREFIVENFLFGDTSVVFDDDDSLMENGILDSTGILELVAFLEKEYGIRIANEEILPENMDTLNNLHRFLETKMKLEQAS
ncbi:MAG TPA: acyl carrier protein [Calditrichae bacterium]|nr:acyl carrier protein [Calditrichia bacterium]